MVSSVAPLDSSQAVFGFWRRFVRKGVAVCPSCSTKLPALAAVVAAVITQTACGVSGERTSFSCSGKATLTASGSSAQQEAMNQFGTAYSKACRGHSVDYTANGSAAGRADFIRGQTDFGGTDTPLGWTPGEAEKARVRCGDREAWNVPLVFGAIAIIYNVAGLDSLVVDAPTTAKIFNGSISQWDAPEITALNPGRLLPASPIVVVSRSDESGTTENFQTYLAAAAGPAWGKGGGESFNGAQGVSAVGNEGAWAAMRQYAGSITYVAWPFAKKNGLPTASIVTSAGSEPVALSAESVSKSVDGVTIAPRGNDLVIDPASFYTPARSGAYPIVMTTYEAVCSAYPDPQTSAAVKTFLTIAVTGAQQGLADSGYVPVPDSVKDRLSIAINAIG